MNSLYQSLVCTVFGGSWLFKKFDIVHGPRAILNVSIYCAWSSCNSKFIYLFCMVLMQFYLNLYELNIYWWTWFAARSFLLKNNKQNSKPMQWNIFSKHLLYGRIVFETFFLENSPDFINNSLSVSTLNKKKCKSC